MRKICIENKDLFTVRRGFGPRLLLLLYVVGCLKFISCGPSNSENEPFSSDSILINPSEIQHTPSVEEEGQAEVPVCIADKDWFSREYGQGVMVLNTSPGDSLLFFGEAVSESVQTIIYHQDSAGWRLKLHSSEKEVLVPYRNATELEHFFFIWLEGNKEGPWKIKLNQAGLHKWIFPDSLKRFHILSWEQYLTYQRIRIDGNPEQNPIRIRPNDQAAIQQDTAQVHYILQVKEAWIQLAPILPQNHHMHPDSIPAVGWLKWYCDQKEQIAILDDYMMEDYFLP